MKKDIWFKFVIASLVVGFISVIYNIIVGYNFSLSWLQMTEKVFLTLIIGIILSFINIKIIKIDKVWNIGLVGFLIALVPTMLETASGALQPSSFVWAMFVRLLGAYLGLFLVNVFYKIK